MWMNLWWLLRLQEGLIFCWISPWKKIQPCQAGFSMNVQLKASRKKGRDSAQFLLRPVTILFVISTVESPFFAAYAQKSMRKGYSLLSKRISLAEALFPRLFRSNYPLQAFLPLDFIIGMVVSLLISCIFPFVY